MATHASTWADHWVERITEEDGTVTTDYAEALDCDTCGRTFIGHGPTTTDAIQDANRMHVAQQELTEANEHWHAVKDDGGSYIDLPTYHGEITTAQVAEMRAWCRCCVWDEDADELAALPAAWIVRGVELNYAGGVAQFLADAT